MSNTSVTVAGSLRLGRRGALRVDRDLFTPPTRMSPKLLAATAEPAAVELSLVALRVTVERGVDVAAAFEDVESTVVE